MNKNKKEYLKPSVVMVLLKSQVHLLTSTIYTHDASNGTEEVIEDSDEIL